MEEAPMNKPTRLPVIPEQLERYKGRDVIPLKGREKRPRDNGWQKQRYDGAKVIAKAIENDTNMGLRLGADDLVIDYDPRNDPAGDSFTRLVKDKDLKPDTFPCVDTGGGGQHYFLQLPPGVKITTTLEAYPGVEFKTLGTQVVCAGSIHPTTGRHYLWDDMLPPLSDVPEAPASLVEAILRPLHDFKSSGGGTHSPEEVAAMLEGLDPADFSDEQKWRELMMACHHASGGDAREEFIAWSWGDPDYANDERIGPRWDSLHTDKPGGITVQTLYKALSDAGRSDLIPRADAASDFANAPPIDPNTIDDGDDFEPIDAKTGSKLDYYKPVKISDLLKLPSPKWLIKNIMIQGGLFEIYGPFKTGKTFWAVELACCIATGHDFDKQKVTQGKVKYVIAEGSRKLFGYRMDAWARQRANGDAEEYKRLRELLELNIDVIPVPVIINDAKKVKLFLAANPGDCALVVIDTLFRSFTGNVADAEAFSKFVQGCDLIRRARKCAVLFLHHQKRNDAVGGFGSVVAEASVDGAYKVGKPDKDKDRTTFKIELMRDGDVKQPEWCADISIKPIDDDTLDPEDVNTVGALTFVERGARCAKDLLRIIRDKKPDDRASLAALAAVSLATVKRWLTELREAGLVEDGALVLTLDGRGAVGGISAQEDFASDEE